MAGRRKTPQYYYNQQKQSAKARGIPWEFSGWEEWYAVWEASGLWEKRGCRKGQYVMARNGDTGTYRTGNVSIIEAGHNAKEGITGWPEKKAKREAGINTSDAAFASPAALENARQFWKEEITTSTPQQTQATTQIKKSNKKIFIQKQKELTFLQKLFFPLRSLFQKV